MSTSSGSMTVRGLAVEVVYKDIKHLHVAVYPPTGRVRVAAPIRLADDQVRLAIIRRWPWIHRRRQQLLGATRQTMREMVSGESHDVWGVRLRLRVEDRPGPARLEVIGDRLLLYAERGTTHQYRERLLHEWYRGELGAAVSKVIACWEPKVGRTVTSFGIRRMKTKWGSCNRESGRIWLNLELARKHPRLLEYVVVHEMTHLIERGHGAHFGQLMDELLPDWRARRDQLNASPLSAETWPADL